MATPMMKLEDRQMSLLASAKEAERCVVIIESLQRLIGDNRLTDEELYQREELWLTGRFDDRPEKHHVPGLLSDRGSGTESFSGALNRRLEGLRPYLRRQRRELRRAAMLARSNVRKLEKLARRYVFRPGVLDAELV